MPDGLIPVPTIGVWFLVTLSCGHRRIWGADRGVPEWSDFPLTFYCTAHGQQPVTDAGRYQL